MDEMAKKLNTKRLLTYLGITFAITYLYEFLVIGNMIKVPEYAPYATFLIASCMLIPTIGMLLTRLVTKEGFSFEDMWIAPKFRGNVRLYLAAWLLPVVAVLAGAALYFAVFPSRFDLNMGYLSEAYTVQGLPFDAASARTMIFIQLVSALLVAPVANAVTCLGEEWGWRGYMMPKLMERFRFGPSCLIGGVIWGLWHMPLTIMGHNYGVGYPGYPFLGIAAMCLFCTVIGVFFSYISLRAKSCWPAVIGHAMINGYASLGIYFTASSADVDFFVGPATTGVLGIVGMMVLALACFVLAKRKPFSMGSNISKG